VRAPVDCNSLVRAVPVRAAHRTPGSHNPLSGTHAGQGVAHLARGSHGPACAASGARGNDWPTVRVPQGERDARHRRRTPLGISCRTHGGQLPDAPPGRQSDRREASCAASGAGERTGPPSASQAQRATPSGGVCQRQASAAGAKPARLQDEPPRPFWEHWRSAKRPNI
jgi:hypothetical protein